MIVRFFSVTPKRVYRWCVTHAENEHIHGGSGEDVPVG